MSDYSKKKLFWIKLSQDFMTSDTVDFLMEQKDGANYVVLYQMLCLKTVNNNGELSRQLGEIIVPYDVEKIQRETKWFTIDTIRIALELFKKLGLIYENQNGCLAISNFDRLLGWTTVGAEKKQLQLAKREGGKLGGKKVEKIPPYQDKDKDISLLNINNNIQERNTHACTHTHEDYKRRFNCFYEFQKTPKYVEMANSVIDALVEMEKQDICKFKQFNITHEQLIDMLNNVNENLFTKIVVALSFGNVENVTTYVWGILFNTFFGKSDVEVAST